MSGADLRGVSLNDAGIQGANLIKVRLEGARLIRADLRRASLNGAQLQGTDLTGGQLQRADLFGTQLQGANLGNGQLQGANLAEARLLGASLVAARLQSADLRAAQLQGASLIGAQLQGTDLFLAVLQGADLSRANLTGSLFDQTFVFRAVIAYADLATASVRFVRADQVNGSEMFGSSLTPANIEAWIAVATQFARGEERDEIVMRLGRLKDDFQTADQDKEDAATWKSFENSYYSNDLDGSQLRERLAKLLVDSACEPTGMTYFGRALMTWGLGVQLGDMNARMKVAREKPDTCKGLVGFTEDDWRVLDAIKPD